MAYLSNIPLATDQIKNSQPQLNANFQSLGNALLGVDSAGLLMTELGLAPTTGVNQGAFYAKQGTNSGVTEAAFRRESNGTSTVFTEGVNASTGWTRVPSGLLVKWQTTTITAQGSGTNIAQYNGVWLTGATIPAFGSTPFAIFLTPIYLTATLPTLTQATIQIGDNATATDFSVIVSSTAVLGGWNAFEAYIIGLGVG